MVQTGSTPRFQCPIVLRALRDACGITQDGWAAHLGVSVTSVRRWERGDGVPNGSVEADLIALCRQRDLFRRYDSGPLAGAVLSAEELRGVIASARLEGARWARSAAAGSPAVGITRAADQHRYDQVSSHLSQQVSAPGAPETQGSPSAAISVQGGRWRLAAGAIALSLVALAISLVYSVRGSAGGGHGRPPTPPGTANPFTVVDLSAYAGQADPNATVKVCFTSSSAPAAADRVAVAITDAPDSPIAGMNPGVLGRSEIPSGSIARGRVCAIIANQRRLLSLRQYWVQLTLNDNVLARLAFFTEPEPIDVAFADEFRDRSQEQLAISDQSLTDAPAFQGYGAPGQYTLRRLLNSRSGPAATGVASVLIPGAYGDAAISLQVRLLDLDSSRFVAVGCRYAVGPEGEKPGENTSYYQLIVRPHSRDFALQKVNYRGVGQADALVGWQTSEAIHADNGLNRLILRCVGDTISAAINGVDVAVVHDRTVASGQFWFGVGTTSPETHTVDARFEDLKVVRQQVGER